MLGITEWRDYITRLAEASENIRHSILVVDVAHLKDRLKELDYSLNFPLLVGVIPTAYASTTLDEDNISELNACMLFVLSPLTREGDDIERGDYITTQDAIVDIKRKIREDYFNCYPVLRGLKFKSYLQEPEWNLLGLIGWSLGFEVETDEYASEQSETPIYPVTYSGGEFLIDGLKTRKTTNQYITRNGEFMNVFPVCSNRQLRLTSIIISGSIKQTWQAEIHNNKEMIAGAILTMENDTYNSIHLDIIIPRNSRLMFFVRGENIENAQIACYFKNV